MTMQNTDAPAAADGSPRISPLLEGRRSVRAFAPTPVPPDVLERLFEAARWAPSSSNEQPWRFIYATRDRPDEFARILSVLNESNAVWARHAPVLMLSIARLDRENGKPNRHAYHDVGQAAAHLTFQGLIEGVAVHQMGGFSIEKAREELGIPDGYDPVAAIAVGYPGSADQLPEPLRERELATRVRKPLADIVFEGVWDSRLP